MNRADEIKKVAHALMLQKGYRAFSYADIADVIGIQKASIHYYFPSKDNLVHSVLQDYRRAAADSLRSFEANAKSPREKLDRYFRYWKDKLACEPTDMCLCAMLASEESILPEESRSEIQAHFEEMRAWIQRVLEEAKASGILRSCGGSSEVEAASVLAAVHGGMIATRAYRDAEQFSMVTEYVLERLMGKSGDGERGAGK
ncbi:TetR/AcrR family transcriptional regulator [Alicyclobacillus acidiphilus]|uniref:TetR/AcrR family transcriptional regulator n=1 Tax=Alicyclobacillus acidiphilus TaxID=182455 RepID=UPI0008367772|nr:TetR/AcrR family transcriptional regulator [Alicyclobacillus acidiphilus]